MAHATHLYRNTNFENTFFTASTNCVSTVFVHVWLTAGAIARRHALDLAGAHDGDGYSARLDAAAKEAKRLRKAEWAHVALVAFDFFFAAMFVFMPDMHSRGPEPVIIALVPGGGVALLARFVLAPARATVLRKQRTNSVAFVGGALRGSLAALMVQAVVLARCVFHPGPIAFIPAVLNCSPGDPCAWIR